MLRNGYRFAMTQPPISMTLSHTNRIEPVNAAMASATRSLRVTF